MSRGIRTLTLLAGAAAFGSRSFGQDSPPGGLPTFRSETQLVLTGFHVVAAKRNIVGLTASDFQLLVDGQPHAITTFEQSGSGNTPVETVLVFDSSGSVHGAGLLDERLFRDNLLADLPEVTLSVYAFGGPPITSLVRVGGPTSDPLVLRRTFQLSLRRTCATYLRDESIAQGQLRHSSVQTTKRHYLKTIPAEQHFGARQK